MVRVYLDICCLKRPFDDQRQERIRREAAAVVMLLDLAAAGQIELVRSAAHLLENGRNPREDRRLTAGLWLDQASVEVKHTEEISRRAEHLHSLGFAVLDALHVAFAEAAGAHWLGTCDDALLEHAARVEGILRTKVANPCEIILEVSR
jgi:predicted nucleic acid-binding protein